MKKILIISPVSTHPVTAGNKQCIMSYSALLKEIGYDVYFLWTTYGFNYDKEEYTATSNYWGEKFLFYRNSIFSRVIYRIWHLLFFSRTEYFKLDSLYPCSWGINQYLKKIHKKELFDVVVVNYVLLSKFFHCFEKIKKILYTHDVFTNKYYRTGKRSGLSWLSLTPNDEAKGLNRADIVLSIQENESVFYRFLTSKEVLTVYSYFVVKQTPLIGRKEILYLSSANSYNIEAITFFVKEVFPELKELYPSIKLIIGGSICAKIKHLVENDQNIELQGYISDVDLFYRQADICINPTFNGTGLKIKTFEALSYGKILVSHPHSVIGIYEKENAPIFLAETKQEYVDRFNFLFNSIEKWREMKEKSVHYMNSFQSYVKKQFETAVNY